MQIWDECLRMPFLLNFVAVAFLQCTKCRVVRHPAQFHLAGFTVAVLRHDTLGNIAFFRVLIIVVIPVQEHHNIGILLNGAGFAQIVVARKEKEDK